jgi:hypothetical protein
VTFRDGKWYCAQCGERLEHLVGVPTASRVILSDKTVTEVVTMDGKEVHWCEVHNDLE